MDKTLIIGNWKMHFTTHQASVYLHKLADKVASHRDVETVLCPNTLTLQPLSLQVNHRQFKLGAQNAHWRDEGAFTGEISASMLHGLVKYLLVGHSERRHIFGETTKDTGIKVQAALRNDLIPVLCVGETQQEHADGEMQHALHDQLTGGLTNVTSEEMENVVIAYEPVWAIGTGDNAHPKDVEKATTYIRHTVTTLYGKKAGTNIRILYGGSVAAENAVDYLSLEDINGLLIGGASLKADTFAKIVEKAYELRKT